jgi:hypothetical protein
MPAAIVAIATWSAASRAIDDLSLARSSSPLPVAVPAATICINKLPIR